MTTIKDISRKCGVSPATVSKALNGYNDISEETAELVRRTAEEMNYMPNAAARLLKTNSSHNIGVVFVDDTMSGLTHEYFSLILNSVKEEAEARGYDITFISQSLGKRKLSFLQHCIYRKCDGVVIACVNFESDAVRELVQSEVPVVTIDYSFDNVSSVISDNLEGAYELTSYMAAQGHRKIAFIHGEDTLVTSRRILGYRAAMEERGLKVPEEYLVTARYHDSESVRREIARLMDLPDPPTAVLLPDDYSFLGAQAELAARGLTIPNDISVAGYDGIKLASLVQPPLTTWYQDGVQIGKLSVKKLVETIEDPENCEAEKIMVSGKLLHGYSVGKREQK